MGCLLWGFWGKFTGTVLYLQCRQMYITLQCRYNEHDGVPNHQPHECLLSRLFNAQTKENIKAPRHWPLCGEFTEDQWIPRTKGQLRGRCFHLITSSWCSNEMYTTPHELNTIQYQVSSVGELIAMILYLSSKTSHDIFSDGATSICWVLACLKINQVAKASLVT